MLVVSAYIDRKFQSSNLGSRAVLSTMSVLLSRRSWACVPLRLSLALCGALCALGCLGCDAGCRHAAPRWQTIWKLCLQDPTLAGTARGCCQLRPGQCCRLRGSRQVWRTLGAINICQGRASAYDVLFLHISPTMTGCIKEANCCESSDASSEISSMTSWRTSAVLW